MLRAGMILLGLSTGLYLPSAIAVLALLVKQEDWGKAMAVHELAPNLGFVAAPLLAEFLLRLGDWRTVLVMVGAANSAMGIIFWRFGAGGSLHGALPRIKNIKPIVSKGYFWTIIGLFGLGIGASLGIYSMLPVYLTTEVGISRSQANFLISGSRVLGMGVALISGVVVDRIGPSRTIFYALSSSGIATMLLATVHNAAFVIPFVIIQPLTAVCFFPAGFSAISSIGSAETRNIAVSLTIPVAFLFGGGVVPAFIGWMGDVSSLGLGKVIVGGVIAAGALCFRIFHKER